MARSAGDLKCVSTVIGLLSRVELEFKRMNRPDFQSDSPSTTYLTTTQVAQALGVSVTTVKRWVDDGILPAHRTPGKHRKLLTSDVMRLIRDGLIPEADLSRLVAIPTEGGSTDPDRIVAELYRVIDSDDLGLVRSLIHGAYRGGVSIEVLADRVIGPVLHTVGHRWETRELEVMHEHRITQAFLSALYELQPMMSGRGQPGRPVAIGGSPEGDHYLLPTLLVRLTLLDSGWDAINLGPNTPMSAFRDAIEEFSPRMMWLSVSHIAQSETFIEEYNALYEVAASRGVTVAIGGHALTEWLRKRMQYTAFGDRMAHLGALARTLHRPPSRPRRGRPPGSKKRSSS